MAGGMFGSAPRSVLLDLLHGAQPQQNALGGLGSILSQYSTLQPNALGALAPTYSQLVNQLLQPNPTILGAYAQNAQPAAPKPKSKLEQLLSTAAQKYPFITKYNPILALGTGNGDYAETWPANEEGDPSYPRPKQFPLGRVGVQIFKPDQFGPDDLAAEFLHVDPMANQTRDYLLKTLSPTQLSYLKQASGDYADTLKQGGSQSRAVQNAVDSAMRGYTVGQWPADVNAGMSYTPAQKAALDRLRQYMTKP